MNITGLKTAQVTSILFVLIGLLGFVGVLDKVLFKKKKPTMLFDLDGTLQDSEEPIQMSFRELYRRYDDVNNFTDELAAEVLGPGLLEMFPKLFPNLDPQKLLVEYREINHELLPAYLKPMKNAVELLKALKEEGYNVGIVTTRAKESTLHCLELTGLAPYIDDVVAMDDVDPDKLKPAIDAYSLIVDRNKWNKDDIIVVGDSIADIMGGKNYGAYTVAYLFNELKKEKVLKCNPDKQITDLIEILDIIKENHYFTYNGK